MPASRPRTEPNFGTTLVPPGIRTKNEKSIGRKPEHPPTHTNRIKLWFIRLTECDLHNDPNGAGRRIASSSVTGGPVLSQHHRTDGTESERMPQINPCRWQPNPQADMPCRPQCGATCGERWERKGCKSGILASTENISDIWWRYDSSMCARWVVKNFPNGMKTNRDPLVIEILQHGDWTLAGHAFAWIEICGINKDTQGALTLISNCKS